MAFVHHKTDGVITACGARARGGGIVTTSKHEETTCPICRSALGLAPLPRVRREAGDYSGPARVQPRNVRRR